MTESSVVTIEQRKGFVLVTVESERMGDAQSRAMQTEVGKAADGAPDQPVVLDLSKVKMLPTLSIGAIVTLWGKFKQENRRFILVGLHEEIRRTLTISRLDRLFEICETVDDALVRLGQ